MKIVKINDKKIKVTISISDLQERNIDATALNYNSRAAQELFWDMMEQAEIELGFITSDSQLCIEAYPDSDEGFTVTITKIDEDGDFESIHKYIKSKYTKKELRSKKKSKKVCSSILMYAFSGIEDLLLSVKNLSIQYSGESTVYKYKNAYYLIIEFGDTSSMNRIVIENMLSEYGTKVTNIAFIEGFLNEHGNKIIQDNAIETLNNYF